jgi:hypothetical protein
VYNNFPFNLIIKSKSAPLLLLHSNQQDTESS